MFSIPPKQYVYLVHVNNTDGTVHVMRTAVGGRIEQTWSLVVNNINIGWSSTNNKMRLYQPGVAHESNTQTQILVPDLPGKVEHGWNSEERVSQEQRRDGRSIRYQATKSASQILKCGAGVHARRGGNLVDGNEDCLTTSVDWVKEKEFHHTIAHEPTLASQDPLAYCFDTLSDAVAALDTLSSPR
ncbi:MAG: hypothetical protein LQ337_008683 [Flavoplaca oasis]|nr:MAG: hypothetical protein LQ337_008683 [Flavoplaca oasis]